MASIKKETRKDFKDLSLEELIFHCKELGKVEWLKEAAQRKTPQVVYPKVEGVNKNGKPCMRADKSKPGKTVMLPITFVELKEAFLQEVCGLKPEGKEKKQNMYDIIANL